MSFPDVSRRRRVSDDTWRVHMEPMPFLWLTLRVTCTLRAWGDGRNLSLEGRQMHIDGMPPELGLADGVRLKVDGALAARRTPPAVRGGAGRLAVAGNVSLGIAAEVPDVIALYPGLDFTVNTILALILERLENSIRKARWALSASAPPPGPAAVATSPLRQSIKPSGRVIQPLRRARP